MATKPPSTRKRASKPATDIFTCPECGKTFTRPAALGAHRKMTHGVAGTSKNATGKRTVATRTRRTTISSRRARATAGSNGGEPTVDRDALLRMLFPNGIPPRQDVVGAVNDWLNEAERLATLGRS